MPTHTREVAGGEVDVCRRDVVRLLAAPMQLRAPEGKSNGVAGNGTTMFGHFAVFNRWTEIDSLWEGRFLERIAPGAFRKTFNENRDSMRVLAEHGGDPMLGNRALGPIDVLREDADGGYYEVPLVDASDVRDLVLPRLRANLYGASFRFRVMREEIVDDPEASDDNPHGLQERTIKEARVFEFGPVTFPAYADATAGVRSVGMTDDFVLEARQLADRDRLLASVEAIARASGVELDDALRAAILGRALGQGDAPTNVTVNVNTNGSGAEEPEPEQAAEAVVEVKSATPEPAVATTSPHLYGEDDLPSGRL